MVLSRGLRTLQIPCDLSSSYHFGSAVRLAAMCCDDLQGSILNLYTGLICNAVHCEPLPGIWGSISFGRLEEGVTVMG